MWVSANAMFRVPSVTMKGGSRSEVTSAPLANPKAIVTRRPSRTASSGWSPDSTASLVMTMLPRAITAPLERSIPAVRMISVWPTARVPTTMTCCTISEKFRPLRNWSDWYEKKTTAIASATSGPRVDRPNARETSDGPGSVGVVSF
jgi:hypothetical protein